MPSSASAWRTNCRSRCPAPLACGRWYVVNWSSLRPRQCCLPRSSLRSRGSLLKRAKVNRFSSDPTKLVRSHHIHLTLTGSARRGCCWPRIRAGRPVRAAAMRTKLTYLFRSAWLSSVGRPSTAPRSMSERIHEIGEIMIWVVTDNVPGLCRLYLLGKKLPCKIFFRTRHRCQFRAINVPLRAPDAGVDREQARVRRRCWRRPPTRARGGQAVRSVMRRLW